MTLITIIISLIIERLGTKGKAWQLTTYLPKYLAAVLHWLPHTAKSQPLVALMLVMPSVLLALLIYGIDFGLITFAASILVLLVSIGCGDLRTAYKNYLNALNRNDNEAATLHALTMGQKRTEQQAGGETFGQTLAWINFRFYFAVLFWFVLLGAPGALFYALVRSAADSVREGDSQLKQHYRFLHTLLYWLDFAPARIASFGYLVIGNFTQGTSCWLKYALDFSVSNRKVVTYTALAAEQVEQAHMGCTLEAACMVRLVKRNILFFLALIALLTLFGDLA